MENIAGFDFFELHYDNDGKATSAGELDALEKQIQGGGVSDVIFIAHGFRNDEGDAKKLYTNFLTSLRAHANGDLKAELGSRHFAVGGVFWPSKQFKEGNVFGQGTVQSTDDDATQKNAIRHRLAELKGELAPAKQRHVDKAIELLERVKNEKQAQDDFIRELVQAVEGGPSDPHEGFAKIRATPGSELLGKLSTPIKLPTVRKSGGGGQVLAVDMLDAPGSGGEGGTLDLGSFFGSIFGRIGQFLNITTWYVMKDRAGRVGENGVAPAVRALKAKFAKVRVHLVGHSLGGRVMAGCAKQLTAGTKVQADSASLLEAAFSHYGLSPGKGSDRPVGFFRDALGKGAIQGPFIATFSAKDTVVGIVYAVASRLADDDVKAIGDAKDRFGGIGRNGAQDTPESHSTALRTPAQGKYQFGTGITCLDGSSGLIKDHGDVTNDAVTYAVGCAIGQT